MISIYVIPCQEVQRKESLVLIALSILVFVTFFLEGVRILDPDFGWHIRMGQFISQNGIPKTDPLSYTMPNYPFIDHEWLTNVMIAKFYPLIGFVGLSVIFSALVLVALLVCLAKGRWKELPFILAAASLMPFFAVRPQVVTWFLLSLLLKVLLNEDLWKRYRYFLPLFFTLWVNLHGGFAVGIVILVLVSGVKVLQRRKVPLADILVLFLSVCATFINPYGFRIWWEVWMQITDNSLRFSISEWMPAFLRLNIAYFMILMLALFSIARYKNRLKKEELALFLLFLVASISSVRHIPLFLLVAVPLIITSFNFVFGEIKTIKLAQKRFVNVYSVVLFISLLLFLGQAKFFIEQFNGREDSIAYPNLAVMFIRQQNFKGNIFAPYEWGGYLDWKLPGKKVFIDGRMPSFRWNAPEPNQSNYAFREYQEIIYEGRDFRPTFKKYNISVVLWPVEEKTQEKGGLVEIRSKIWGKINESWIKIEKFIPFSDPKSFKPLDKRLKEAGWKEVYRDQTAVIYSKF